MSKEQDDFCPACRTGYCQFCYLHTGEADNPDYCLCDCKESTLARERLSKNYQPAVAQEPKRTTDLAKLQDAMNQGDILRIMGILFP